MALLLLFGFFSAGCQDVAVKDDVDVKFDFLRLLGVSDGLHSPYVVGASLRFFVETSDFDEDQRGWTVESSDSSILALDVERDGGRRLKYAKARAIAPGTVELRVYNGKREVERSVTVEIKVPDRVEVWAHGPMLIDHPEEAPVSELRILKGGTATYLLRYYTDNVLLSGNGAFDAPLATTTLNDAGLAASRRGTYLDEDRDWLQVATLDTASDRTELPISVGGFALGTIPIVTVGADAVADIQLRGQDESKARDDDWLVVLAEAKDVEGRVVYGVEYEWTIDAAREAGLGDLYRYKFKRGDLRALAARFGGQRPSVMIQWGAGYVDSTNHLGCSSTPGRADAPLTLAGVVVAFLMYRIDAAARRRRRYASNAGLARLSGAGRRDGLRPR